MKTNSAIERNYQFRQRLNQVHAPDRRNVHAAPTANEWMIENGGRIIISASASTLIVNTARQSAPDRINEQSRRASGRRWKHVERIAEIEKSRTDH